VVLPVLFLVVSQSIALPRKKRSVLVISIRTKALNYKQRKNSKAMSKEPTVIEEIALALSSLNLEEGRIYKSRVIWPKVRNILGMENGREWKRLQSGVIRQLVDVGAIERVPGKYQMKVVNTEVLLQNTRAYNPHQNPRQPNAEAGQSKTESIEALAESVDAPVIQVVAAENPLEGFEEAEWTITLTLKESVIINLLLNRVIKLSDILTED
jgi:hypothetical protein